MNQVLVHLNKNGDIEIENLLDIINEHLNYNDIITLFDYIDIHFPLLKNQLGIIENLNIHLFEKKYSANISEYSKLLETGYFICYLIALKYEIQSNLLNPLFNNLKSKFIKDLDLKINQNTAKLDLEFENKEHFSLTDCLFSFFIYEHIKAFRLLKNNILKSIEESNNNHTHINLTFEINNFFRILNLDYIPLINQKSIDTKIHKNEILVLLNGSLDNERSIPLSKIDNKIILELVNNLKKNVNNHLIYKVLITYLKDLNIKNMDYRYMIRVILDNLTNINPTKYSNVEYNYCRDTLNVCLSQKENLFKLYAALSFLKDSEYLEGLSKLLPKLLAEYLNVSSTSEQSIKNYVFLNKNSNKIIENYKNHLFKSIN
ncbi:hypothetical protein HX088_07385 [Empedobacter sp. 225-1]|uniref:hypothetical protein n=1 Tax=Empedobacter sp. 225-1 TaxID=2746725 RepID=UPI002577C9F3|nr:hypothetical protein [Empedobacter sp. 225-1]MDM1523088.1 hypothetical protein [Empedobacter sp. 225-1]